MVSLRLVINYPGVRVSVHPVSQSVNQSASRSESVFMISFHYFLICFYITAAAVLKQQVIINKNGVYPYLLPSL